MIHRAIFSSLSLRPVTIAAALVVLTLPTRIDAQTVATMFKRAQAQEAALPKTDPAIVDLRRAANAYEAVVRRYPSSSYSDDSLWQAAALMERAHSKSGTATDLDKALKLLAWLRREYPRASTPARRARNSPRSSHPLRQRPGPPLRLWQPRRHRLRQRHPVRRR